MKKINELLIFTKKSSRAAILGCLLLLCAICLSGCPIKIRIRETISPKIAAARNATLAELINIVNKYDEISDLKNSSLKVALTSGKWESGQQDEYRGATGYVLLKHPSSLHLIIQTPVFTTALFDIVSTGDDFFAWLRNKANSVYHGRNSAKNLTADDLPQGIPLRPAHLYEAIIPSGINLKEPGLRISVEEAADKTAKYYILSVYKEGTLPVIHTIRRIWIERSQMVVSRQQLFDDAGRMVGDILYSDVESVDGFLLFRKIDLHRPEDGYALKMEFLPGSWSLNSGLDDGAFVLSRMEGAEIVQLKED